jgi:hypothetical protein
MSMCFVIWLQNNLTEMNFDFFFAKLCHVSVKRLFWLHMKSKKIV